MRAPRLSRAQLATLVAVAVCLGCVLGASFGSARVGLAVLLGPLSGAALYPGHSDRLEFSLSILPWSLALVAAGAGLQCAVAPTSLGRRAVRWIGWIAALVGWFGGALLSDLQALE
jgi:hypothetical protein